MMDMQTGQERAAAIITIMDQLDFADQVAILIGVMMSYIVANCPGDSGEQIIANVSEMLPRQYMEAKALLRSPVQ
jgi:hypothetical protein